MSNEEDNVFDGLLEKRQSSAQRIDDKGVAIFNAILSRTNKLSLPFNKQDSNDFGIDGELQVLSDGKNTGEKYKVQIKSSEHTKYIKGKTIISFSLDVRSTYSLLKVEKVPTALILVDVTASRVFWSAVQIDETVAKSLAKTLKAKNEYARRKKLSEEKKKELLDATSITVHVPVENEITPDKFEPLLDALKKSAISVSKNTIVATKGVSLMEGVRHLSDIEDDILKLHGYDIVQRASDAPVNTFSVMSLGYGKNSALDLVPNKDFHPDLLPIITLNGFLDRSKAEDAKIADDFNRLLRGEPVTVTLTGSQINSLVIKSGETLIDEMIGGSQTRLTIAPFIEKKDIDLVVSNGHEELVLKSKISKRSEGLFFETNEKNALSIKLSLNEADLKSRSQPVRGTININIRNEAIENTAHHLRLLRFIREAENINIGFITEGGFRERLFEGEGLNKALVIPDEFYELIEMLLEIEKRIGQKIKYPLLHPITVQQATEVRRVFDTTDEGWLAEGTSLSLGVDPDLPDEIKKLKRGDEVVARLGEAKVTVLGQTFEVPGYIKLIEGKLDNIKRLSGEDKHTHRITFLQSKEVLVREVDQKD